MLVLIFTAIVTVIGVSSLMVARIESVSAAGSRAISAAQFNAHSGAEVVLHALENDPNWRDTYTHETWEPLQPIGDGAFKWMPVDQVDEDLGDDPADPVRIVVWGMSGNATRKLSFQLGTGGTGGTDSNAPLQKAICSTTEMRVKNSGTLTVTGAPASTNGELRIDGVLNGDAEGGTQWGWGTINGTATVPGPSVTMPPSSVFDDYVAKATTLPFNGNIDAMVLSPAVNEYGGGLDADGVYFIDTGGASLIIRGSRIHGTLVIDAGIGVVTIEQQVFMENHRADHPVLLVKADTLALDYTSGSSTPAQTVLSESAWGHNFNPSGAPFEAQADADQVDDYPCEIRGLVHVIGEASPRRSSLIRGALLCHGRVRAEETTDGGAVVIHDPDLAANPPEGYTVVGGGSFAMTPTDWRQEVD